LAIGIETLQLRLPDDPFHVRGTRSFSNLLSIRDALNCTDTGRLTGCPARVVSPSCPIFSPPHLTIIGFCAVLDRTRWHVSQFRHGDDQMLCRCGCGRRPTQPQRVAIGGDGVRAGVAPASRWVKNASTVGASAVMTVARCARVRRAYGLVAAQVSRCLRARAQNFTGLDR